MGHSALVVPCLVCASRSMACLALVHERAHLRIWCSGSLRRRVACVLGIHSSSNSGMDVISRLHKGLILMPVRQIPSGRILYRYARHSHRQWITATRELTVQSKSTSLKWHCSTRRRQSDIAHSINARMKSVYSSYTPPRPATSTSLLCVAWYASESANHSSTLRCQRYTAMLERRSVSCLTVSQSLYRYKSLRRYDTSELPSWYNAGQSRTPLPRGFRARDLPSSRPQC